MVRSAESGSQNHNGSRETRETKFLGIKSFKGDPLPASEEIRSRYKTLTLDRLRETHKVWRPEETLEAAKSFFEEGRVNVVGAPQSGKGTIMFGLTEICEAFDWGYIFIDGHHQEASASDVIGAIVEAERRNVPVFFDSFDYLFLGSRRYRTISIAAQEERTTKIIDTVTNAKIPVAITHHDEEWANLFLNKNLKDRFKPQVDTFPVYQIPDSFKSPESIRRFLTDQNISPREAGFLANFAWEKPMLMRFKAIFSSFVEEQAVETLYKATANFPVLKEVARDNQQIFLPILTKVTHEGNQIDDSTLASFVNMILEAEKKRVNLASIRWNNGKR